MPNGHFGLAGAYEVDPGAWLQRTHEERRRKEEWEARCEAWFAKAFLGQTFTSFDQMLAVALATADQVRGPFDDEHRETYTRAVRTLWAGLSFAATLRAVGVKTERRNGTVSFLRAA